MAAVCGKAGAESSTKSGVNNAHPALFPHGSEGESHVCCVKRAESKHGICYNNTHTHTGVLEQTAHSVCHDSELCHKFQRPSSHVNDNSNRDRSRRCAREDRGEGGGTRLLAYGNCASAQVCMHLRRSNCGAPGALEPPTRARIGNARGRLWRPECTAARAASSSARWRASVCTDLPPGCCCAATCASVYAQILRRAASYRDSAACRDLIPGYSRTRVLRVV